MKPCTSNYAVEARASAWESAAKSLRTPAHKSVPFGRNVARLLDEAAALLRALVAERQAALGNVRGLEINCASLAKAFRESQAKERTAYVRGAADAREQAATLVATHAYAVNNAGPYLKPSEHAAIDVHHKTIAAAIRALPLPEPQA